MLLRQVQAHQASRRGVRPLRRGSDFGPRAPGTDGPHRAGGAGFAYLVLQVHAVPAGTGAGHDGPEPGTGDLLRGLHGDQSRLDAAEIAPVVERARVPRSARDLWRGRIRGQDGRGSGAGSAGQRGFAEAGGSSLGGHDGNQEQTNPQEGGQAHQAALGLSILQGAARMDGPDRPAGHPARFAPAGAAGRRPLRHLRPERPLPARDQPQQPPEEPSATQDAGGHHPQRETDVAGSGGRAV